MSGASDAPGAGREDGGEGERASPRRPSPDRPEDKPSNAAPDAVRDPSEKTDGKPGVPPQGDETDPGAG